MPDNCQTMRNIDSFTGTKSTYLYRPIVTFINHNKNQVVRLIRMLRTTLVFQFGQTNISPSYIAVITSLTAIWLSPLVNAQSKHKNTKGTFWRTFNDLLTEGAIVANSYWESAASISSNSFEGVKVPHLFFLFFSFFIRIFLALLMLAVSMRIDLSFSSTPSFYSLIGLAAFSLLWVDAFLYKFKSASTEL